MQLINQRRERGVHLGLNGSSIQQIIENFQTFMVCAHRVLWEMNSEFHYYSSFIRWLKYLLDEASNTEVAPEEADTKIETTDVATFITDYLSVSTMDRYFADSSKVFPKSPEFSESDLVSEFPWAADESAGRRVFKPSDPVDMRSIIKQLITQCGSVFKESADAMKKHALFGSPLRIKDSCDVTKIMLTSRIIKENDMSFMLVALSLDPESENGRHSNSLY